MKVEDETGYFESGSIAELKRNHSAMASLVGAMRNNPKFLERVLNAAGIAGEVVEVLPSKLEVPVSLPKVKPPTIQ